VYVLKFKWYSVIMIAVVSTAISSKFTNTLASKKILKT
jgi:hypothetical protein